MRWFIIKLVNFFVVLIIVTFIVAAIFSGPLTERQIQAIREEMRQAVMGQLRSDPTGAFRETIINQYIKYLKNNGQLDNIIRQYIDYLRSQGKEVSPDQVNPREALKWYYESRGGSLEQAAIQWYIDQQVRDEIRRRGLDAPWYIISAKYTKKLLTFEPIRSSANLQTRGFFFYPPGDRNAYHIIFERVPFSILLFTTSSVLTLLFAIPLALYAARNPGNLIDNTIMAWSVFSVSMPWWWLAMVFIYLFTVKYKIFPSVTESINVESISNLVSKAALPVITVTSLSVGDTAYRLRNILLDVFNEDFVVVARAKGVPEPMVLRKYILRTAAPPIVTIVLFSIVLSIFAGAIITELIFNWPGLGRLYWEAIQANDIPVLAALTYITTLIYLVLRLVLDILYTILDPRIRRA